MRKPVIILIVIMSLVLAACGNKDSGTTFQTISMDQAKEMIDQSSSLIVLDVRTPEEYAEGHIPNALLYPVQELEGRLGELDKNQTYIVVCRSGNRSQTASELLAEHGFKHIYNTSGGMNEWKHPVWKN